MKWTRGDTVFWAFVVLLSLWALVHTPDWCLCQW